MIFSDDDATMRAASYAVEMDFSYGSSQAVARGDAHVRDDVGVGVYADRSALRAALRDDLEAVGVAVRRIGSLGDILHRAHDGPLPDITLVDCPQVGLRDLAALAKLDMRAASAGCRLIVSTSVDALDGVFACLDQSDAQILVDPDHAERVLALGRVLASIPKPGVRELSEDDRLMILRLTEQVGQIAGRIDRLSPPAGGAGITGTTAAHSAGQAFVPPGQLSGGQRSQKPALPDAKAIRRMIRQRQLRSRFLDGALFADPAWDMLLDLAAAKMEGIRVSVSSLCIAASVPATTALRWIGQMVESGLFVRVCDEADRRRAFIELSENGAEAMARYFEEIAHTARAS